MYTTWIKMKSEVMCYPWARSWEYRMKITANQEHAKVEELCGKWRGLVGRGWTLSEVEGPCQKWRGLVRRARALWEVEGPCGSFSNW